MTLLVASFFSLSAAESIHGDNGNVSYLQDTVIYTGKQKNLCSRLTLQQNTDSNKTVHHKTKCIYHELFLILSYPVSY